MRATRISYHKNVQTAGVIGWISDRYCSIKPLCSGMVEVVPARTSPTLLLHPLALCCDYPVSKCPSASIVVTSTVRINIPLRQQYKQCKLAAHALPMPQGSQYKQA